MSQTEQVAPPEETRETYVRLPFTLTRPNGERVHYPAGKHPSMPVADAESWYTKLHLQRDEDPMPAAEAGPSSDADRAARLVAEEDNTRLKVQLRNGEEARVKLVAERDALQNRVNEVEAENATLREQLDADDTATETATSEAEVGVRRKGRRWFVHMGTENLGEFGSKEEAETKAAELRAAPPAQG